MYRWPPGALQHAERKVRTYGKALFALASLLCLSVCGNLASSALTILVSKESRVPLEWWFLIRVVPFSVDQWYLTSTIQPTE